MISKKYIKFMIKKIKGIDKKTMDDIVSIIAYENNKCKLFIYLDMYLNFLTRGIGYTDYFRGNYINLSKSQKDTFVTTKTFYKIHNYLNDSKYLTCFNNKLIFNSIFRDYLRRSYINLLECSKLDFMNFLSGKNVVFAKIPDGFGGHGVSRLVLKEYDLEKLYKQLLKNGQYLIEEEIVQCKELNKINPNVVCSFRVITLYKNGKVYILNNALRVNKDSSEIIGCTNDLYFSFNEDGIIDSNVIDDYGQIYKMHPLTGMEFKRVKLDFVKEAFEMCKKAALRIPQVRYVGWDVAFTDKGPLIIEGNEYPGYGLIQFYKLKNKSTGHLKEISDILKDEMKNIKL